MPSIDTETLTSVAKDVLCRLNLPLCKHCGQCCDGASSMRGAGFGVAKRIVDEKLRGVYIHCYGHSVNLAVNDAVKTSKTLQNALETTHEVTKLIKYSPHREEVFHNLKANSPTDQSPGIRLLCPTCWTVQADALAGIISNYETLLNTWEECVDLVKDTESKARIIGVHAQMKNLIF